MIEEALNKSLIVIPSINGGHLLERMLPTLKVPNNIVLVIDQGSTDNTEAVCRAAGVEVLQLGRPHTYTEACNIGAKVASKRGCDYVFVGNNDITFTTDVARELLSEMLQDPELGIIAPSQLIIDEATNRRLPAYRAYWNLSAAQFEHDFKPPSGDPERLESDFCELTFALVRTSTIAEIGFLDNEYGFYFEDADFGFRLRQAGYSCAYLPRSQIEHFVSSTFRAEKSAEKLKYLQNNKRLFASKHLGYGVRHADHKSDDPVSWNIINRNLHPYLARYGLIDDRKPELIFSHPGTPPFDYLYTVWETSRLPSSWLKFRDAYKLVLVTSRWVGRVFENNGFSNVHCVPLGVETDVFQPWGNVRRLHQGKTFLWFSRNQHRKGLDVMLKAWEAFHRARPDAQLVLMGAGIEGRLPWVRDRQRRWDNFLIADYLEQGISVYETLSPMDDQTLANVYRGVDFTVCSSRSEGFGFVIAESMASGTPAIFGNYGATEEFGFDDALTLNGTLAPAVYTDKGFDDVGDWWEPSVEHLRARLFEADNMDGMTYASLSRRGVRLIRNRFSWRTTVMALRSAIATVQERTAETEAETAAIATVQERTAEIEAETAAGKQIGSARAVSRWSRFAHNMRRVSSLIERFAAQLETHGARIALHSAASWIAIFLRRRWQRIGQLLSSLVPEFVTKGRTLLVIKVRPLPARRGILFVGYVEAGLGLGESLRGLIAAATARDLQFGIYPFRVGVETRIIEPFMPEKYDQSHRYDLNVIAVAADQVPTVFGSLDSRLYAGNYNVLHTYWELPRAPAAWVPMLRGVDEIWAPNEFVRSAFRNVFPGTITIVPPCVVIDETAVYPGRRKFGLDDRRFYYLFSFDYYSHPDRKNPLGVLKAFQDAFRKGDENVGLIIKSTGAPAHYPEIKQRMQAAMEVDPRIKIFDRTMTRREVLGLIQSCDCYVSLHRAEGFGLGMVEAMNFGKAVIGTDFSGSTDFLTEQTGFPVSYELRPIQPNEYVWTEGQSWAEPNHQKAIELLKLVFENPQLGTKKGDNARAFVRQRYSKDAVGAVIEARIAEIAK